MGQEEPASKGGTTAFAVLVALSVSHLLNDTIQSLIAAVYPVLKESYALTFTQIGLITLAFQCTASLLQPLVGLYTDRRPLPFSLALGMGVTLCGLLLLSAADNFPAILLAAALVGVGSAVFHPEASRMARLSSGGRHGLAQSLFQVGGNGGSALGPLLAAFIVVPWGQGSLAWFSVAAVAAMLILFRVGLWYRAHLAERAARAVVAVAPPVSPGKAAFAVGILLVLIFSKYFYLASLTSYYTLYLIETFHVGVADAQLRLFVFLGAVAAGTFLGGPVGDRVGFKAVIWGSILGVLPFTLLLPHADLFWTTVLTVPDRADPGVGLLGHHGVCPGTAAEPGRDGSRAVLRVRVRDGRGRGGGPRLAGRPDQHRVRVPRVRLPAGHRAADGVAAEPPAVRVGDG